VGAGEEPDGQARILGRAYTKIMRGAERWTRAVYRFAWRDTDKGQAVCGWCPWSGLLNRDGERKPAYYAARAHRRLARQLVRSSAMPLANVRVPAFHRPAGGSIEERLARTEDHGDDGEMHLVEQPGVGELRGDVAAADDPGCVRQPRRSSRRRGRRPASAIRTSTRSPSGTRRSRELSVQ
jgi:hypothetical protein